MVKTVYSIVIGYFLIGGLLLLYITRNKDRIAKRTNWIKYITYFIIVNIILLTIFYFPKFFPLLAFIILFRSSYELSSLQKNGDREIGRFFALSLSIFAVLAFGFLYFSFLDANIILYVILSLQFPMRSVSSLASWQEGQKYFLLSVRTKLWRV